MKKIKFYFGIYFFERINSAAKEVILKQLSAAGR